MRAAWLLGLLAWGCAPAPEPRFEPPGTRYSYTVTPRLALGPAYVRARLLIIGPTEVDYCLRWLVDWGDGSLSGQQSDCSPWGPPYPEFILYGPPMNRPHLYRLGGVYPVQMDLIRGDRVVRRFILTAEIRTQ